MYNSIPVEIVTKIPCENRIDKQTHVVSLVELGLSPPPTDLVLRGRWNALAIGKIGTYLRKDGENTRCRYTWEYDVRSASIIVTLVYKPAV